jgi:hypothetical protein
MASHWNGWERRHGERRAMTRPDCNERRRAGADREDDDTLVWVRSEDIRARAERPSVFNMRRCASCSETMLIEDLSSEDLELAMFCADCLDRARPAQQNDYYDELGWGG